MRNVRQSPLWAEAIHTDAQRILHKTEQSFTVYQCAISVIPLIVVHKKIFKTFFGVMYLYEYKTVNMQMLQYTLAL